jgi:hypothetical protein
MVPDQKFLQTKYTEQKHCCGGHTNIKLSFLRKFHRTLPTNTTEHLDANADLQLDIFLMHSSIKVKSMPEYSVIFNRSHSVLGLSKSLVHLSSGPFPSMFHIFIAFYVTVPSQILGKDYAEMLWPWG